MHGHQPHPATPISDAAFLLKTGIKRGNYNCGRCGQPKKGHKCLLTTNDTEFSTPISTPAAVEPISAVPAGNLIASPSISMVRPMLPMRRRALSFDEVRLAEVEVVEDDEEEEVKEVIDLEVDFESEMDQANCLWEVFRRLPPAGLMAAAMVSKEWRDSTRKVWKAVEELTLRVPAKAHSGFVGSVLQKCPGLVKLNLIVESDFDATMLACIAFSCCNLQSLEISTSDSSTNRITGHELSRFIAEKRCLTSLKMEGCCNLGGFTFSSTSLNTLWLSDLHSLSRMVFNCPNLKEVSLDFSRKENDSTNLTSAMDGLGRSCPKLQNIHIASVRLTHEAVLALSAANLRGLRMLSLVLGSEITDASVAAITSSFTKLELLDLSGSSISDSGIGMICNCFSETLSKLLLALCPNITSSGIQFATAQLPCLELMDCGMTISDPNSGNSSAEEDDDSELQETPNSKLHLIYQKLIIKHNRLRKLSLWGCSGLDALYLNCPRLNDLNLNSCRNLYPDSLVLQCPNLESVHASDCKGMLVKAIKTQVNKDLSAIEKRLPDGSKRVRVPYAYSPQPSEDEKKWRKPAKRQCVVIST